MSTFRDNHLLHTQVLVVLEHRDWVSPSHSTLRQIISKDARAVAIGYYSDYMASPHPSTAPVVPLEADRISEDRITIVESDPDLSDHDGPDEPVSREVVPYVNIKLTWLDHLRGLFCFGTTHQIKVAFEQPSHTEVSHPFLNLEDATDKMFRQTSTKTRHLGYFPSMCCQRELIETALCQNKQGVC